MTTAQATRRIELAVDHEEAADFAGWLRRQGHDVTVGRTTGSYVDGARTASDADASDWLNAQWAAYCNA